MATPIDNIFLTILSTYSAERLPADAETAVLLKTLAEQPEDFFTDDQNIKKLIKVFETLAEGDDPEQSHAPLAVSALNQLLQTNPSNRLYALQARAESFAERAPKFPLETKIDPTFKLNALNRLINQIDVATIPAEQPEKATQLADRIKLFLGLSAGLIIVPLGLAVLAGAATIGILLHPLRALLESAKNENDKLSPRQRNAQKEWPELAEILNQHPFPQELHAQYQRKPSPETHGTNAYKKWHRHPAVLARIKAMGAELVRAYRVQLDALDHDFTANGKSNPTQALQPHLNEIFRIRLRFGASLTQLDAVIHYYATFDELTNVPVYAEKNRSFLKDAADLEQLAKSIPNIKSAEEDAEHPKYAEIKKSVTDKIAAMQSSLDFFESWFQNLESVPDVAARQQAILAQAGYSSVSPKKAVPATPAKQELEVIIGERDEYLLAIQDLQTKLETMAAQLLDRLNLLPDRKQEVLKNLTENLQKQQQTFRKQYGDEHMPKIFLKEIQILLNGLQANVHVLLAQDIDPTDKELARTRILQLLRGNREIRTLRNNPFFTPQGVFWAPLEFRHRERLAQPMPEDGEFYYFVDGFLADDENTLHNAALREHIGKGKTVINVYAADQDLSRRKSRLAPGELLNTDRFNAELPHAIKSVQWQTAEHYGVPPHRVRLTPMPLIRPKSNVRAFTPKVRN